MMKTAPEPQFDTAGSSSDEPAGNGRGRRYLRIGDLARIAGKSPRAIHLYEEMGLLQPVSRTKGGFRLYAPSSEARMRWIGLLNSMGFSLQQIKHFVDELQGTGTGPKAMARLQAIFTEKLAETRVHLRQLEDVERELVAGLEYLRECGTCSDPEGLFEACAGCPYPHHTSCRPSILAGLYAGRSEGEA
jgi:DNA-binding transcriptional MerR regulator